MELATIFFWLSLGLAITCFVILSVREYLAGKRDAWPSAYQWSGETKPHHKESAK
jgi:hypothetical protein